MANAFDRVVAHRRVEPPESLDYFPTPPWAARALFHHVLGRRGFREQVVEEPACGEGHMAYALADLFGEVWASDIHPYGYGTVRDFLGGDMSADDRPDWIVTNPPFGPATLRFMRRAVSRARRGVALLVRPTQLSGVNRWRYVYRQAPPAIIAPYVERVPIHKGRWEPYGDTQTDYCWLVWRFDRSVKRPETVWIPPCRWELTYTRDIERFAPWALDRPQGGRDPG